MDDSNFKCITDAVTGVGFVIGSSILFAGAVVADGMTRSSEANPSGGSIQMVAFFVALVFFVMGMRRLRTVTPSRSP